MKKFFLFFYFFTTFLSFSQEVKFEANVNRNSLGENEFLNIVFEANRDGDNFRPPSFRGFQIIIGPVQEVNQSIINGRRSFSIKYSYTIQPKQKGKLTIGSASIEIDGKEYKTTPISVEVGEPVKTPQNQPQTNNGGQGVFPFGFDPFGFDPFGEQQNHSEADTPEISKEDVFIKAEISKRNPFLNEPFSLIYKLYVSEKIGISNLEKVSEADYLDFIKEDFSPKEYSVKEEILNGKKYRTIELKRLALYPQKAKELIIYPLTIQAILQIPTNRVDFYRRRQVVTMRHSLTSERQVINVRELPLEGKPEFFSGAVGDFSMEVNLSKNQVKSGETLSARMSVVGKGNFNLFDIPTLEFPNSLEVYPPELKENINNSLSGRTGSVTNIYTLVPQYKGKYPIPSVNFSFFNPQTEKYVTLSSQNLNIEVIDGEEMPDSVQKTEKTQSKHFEYIKLKTTLKPLQSASFLHSWAFYGFSLLAILLLPIGIFLIKMIKNKRHDVERAHIRTANLLAKKYLSNSRKYFGKKEEFYQSLEKGLHNYLKARLRIETSELSKERIREILSEKSVDTEWIEGFIKLLSNCEMARYSPYTQTDMENDYTQASEVISNLDKQIR